ncbi:hypothetical protein [Burkholderia phage FLC9]|nr:hypothetical protein [Burkholderia phage FLC9]
MDKKNPGLRVTIDGHGNMGKTTLMNAFAEFLKMNGIEGVITLTDQPSALYLHGQDAIDRLKKLNEEAPSCFEKIVFVERHVSRPFIMDTALRPNDMPVWDALPELDHDTRSDAVSFSLPSSQIGFEMRNRVRSQFIPTGTHDLYKLVRHLPEQVEARLLDMVSIYPEEYTVLVRLNELVKERLGRSFLFTKPTVEQVETARFAMGYESVNEGVVEGRAARKQRVADQMKYVAPPSRLQAPIVFQQTSPVAGLLGSLDPSLLFQHLMLNRGYEELWKEHRIHLLPINREKDGDWYDEIRAKHEPENVSQCWALVTMARIDGESVTPEDHHVMKKACQDYDPLIFVLIKIKNASISGAHVSSMQHLNRTADTAHQTASTPLFDRAAHARIRDAARGYVVRSLTDGHKAFEMPTNVYASMLGEDNGDHNGDLSPLIYQQQIHPLTGETRDQMLLRAQPYIKTKSLGEHMALDYSDLPADLIFDRKCGIRWRTQEEMVELQKLVDRFFEAAQNPDSRIVRGANDEVLNVFAPTPRGMRSAIYQIDDAGFMERPDHPTDPVIKATTPEDVAAYPNDPNASGKSRLNPSEGGSASQISKAVSTAAANLGKVFDGNANGTPFWPPQSEE